MESAAIGSIPQHLSVNTNQPPSGPRKRKRKTFACIICQRRKLKCDQALPACGRCIKSGVECDFGDHDEQVPANSGVRNDTFAPERPTHTRNITSPSLPSGGPSVTAMPFPKQNAWSSADVRPDHTALDSYTILRQHLEWKESGTVTRTTAEADSNHHILETMLFKGSEFSTQFYGATSPISLLRHVCIRTFL